MNRIMAGNGKRKTIAASTKKNCGKILNNPAVPNKLKVVY